MTNTLFIDTECFVNYWLLSCMDESGNVQHFDTFEGQALDVTALRKTLKGKRIVTFNGNSYDLLMISLALRGVTCATLKQANDNIILNNMRSWQFENEYKIKIVKIDHIDLIEVAPGQASLKTYAGRLFATNLQDLPLAPSESISEALRPVIRSYCHNDLRATELLFKKLLPQIQLREKMGEEYGTDLRSKSDAQIAEVVLAQGVAQAIGKQVEKPVIKKVNFSYQVPDFLVFQTTKLKALLEMVASTKFGTDSKGVVRMPDNLDGHTVRIGDSTYRLGIGGLHSSESKVHHIADADHLLMDWDVASYYPSIILTNGLFPVQMGPAFLTIYRGIVQRRLEAKHNGDKVTNEALKITINGSFGKLGSPYSLLYAPHLLIQTTVTGQLALLMLIEMLELSGVKVVSANTDGIVVKCQLDKEQVMLDCMTGWQIVSGFDLESTHYKAIYSRDVNNYIAMKPDGKFKLKGAYAPAGLSKNPTNAIVIEAVLAYLQDATPVDKTIRACRDVEKFLTLRNVKGGAVDSDGEHLGRVVRWYYSTTGEGSMHYASNGNVVARSTGAKALMQLDIGFPSDIDYHWYTKEAIETLRDFGITLEDKVRMGDMLDEVAA